MSQSVTINLNNMCLARVTASGVVAMRKYYASLRCSDILERQYPGLAPGMVIRTQLWDLFQMFGPSMSLADSPLETDIQIINIGD